MTTDNEAEAEQSPPKRTRATRKSTTAKSATKAPAAKSKSTRSKAAAADKATKTGSRKPRTKAEPEAAPTVEAAPQPQPRPVPRLMTRFREEVLPALVKEFSYTSPMQAPRLTKIVLNIGLGEALTNPRAIENATRDLSLITGQRPVTTRARKSIANFKIREGMALGISVTLRGRRMYEFFDRLVSSSLPRIRDFRGISREAFDGRGNYSLGIREQVIFPEIDYNSIDRIRSLQVVVVTTARSDQEGLRLLEMLGMPLVRREAEVDAA